MENMSGYNMQGPQPAGRQKGKLKGPVLAAIIAAAVLVVVVMIAVAVMLYRMVSADISGGLDVVYIEGTIGPDSPSSIFTADTGYSQRYIINTIEDLTNDDTSKGILLYINSPGGSIYETDEVYLKLLEYKATGRPVYAYMAQTAASGGYYISCAADKIYCNRNTLTGSIGVIYGTYIDLSGFLANYGIQTHTFTSGENKSMGSSYEPMTEGQKAIFQSIVDEAYQQFVGVVMTGRGLAQGEVYTLADGRVYTANQALQGGLVDEIASYEDALRAIKIELGDENMPENEHLRATSAGFSTLFGSIGGLGGRNESEVILDVLSAYNKTGYYCSELAQ